MFNRILVPLDGSLLAERALPHAVLFARIFGSKVILLHVLNPISYHENPDAVDPLKWQIRKVEADIYMQGIAARISQELESDTPEKGPHRGERADEVKPQVEYFILEGRIADNIINFAHSEKIDLLIISTHGASGLSRWNMSSVCQKVINMIYLPILLIRAYNQPDIIEGRLFYHRILLPIDSSRRAECSLSAGIALASGENKKKIKNAEGTVPTKLILAAVLKQPEIPIPAPYPTKIKELSEQLIQVSRLSVNNYLQEMRDRQPDVFEICVVENDSIPTAIQELADQDERIGLVVLCAHGHTGQATWPYGTVARNYLEYGNKNVLIVQDLPRSKVKPSAAEIAFQNAGGI